jgi:hypothetical protein
MTNINDSIVGRTRICQYGGFDSAGKSAGGPDPHEAVNERFMALWNGQKAGVSRTKVLAITEACTRLMARHGCDNFRQLPEEALQELDAMMDQVEEL